MPPGKLAAQAGHAFLASFLAADAARRDPYAADPPGTKLCLAARDLPHLLALHDLALEAALPCALITDSGHVLPPYFDGSDVVTALGIGPATREEVASFTRRLPPA